MRLAITNRLDWILFVLLGFLWGSSHLFIKIGLESGLPPLTLVMLRLAFGFGLLAAIALATRISLPRDPKTYGHILVLGVISMALPFALIAWAERSVDSSLASITSAAIPLFVLVIAAIFLHDERITLNRLVGLLIGFGGMAVLLGFDGSGFQRGEPGAEVALLVATMSYAAGGVYARRFVRDLAPLVPALIEVAFATVIATGAAFSFERPLEVTIQPQGLLAVAWLGVFGSGLAYVIFFRLIGRWGATKTSMVAYLMPIFGIVLGAAVADEAVTPRLLAGTVLVVGGIALVNASRAALPFRRKTLVVGHGRAA